MLLTEHLATNSKESADAISGEPDILKQEKLPFQHGIGMLAVEVIHRIGGIFSKDLRGQLELENSEE